jgi:collagenase-like PrtC family protease
MHPTTATSSVELVCPAGTLSALQAAVDNGANAVYFGFRNGSNARAFPGLNLSPIEAEAGVTYAQGFGARAFTAINVFPDAQRWSAATDAVDQAAELGVDALILADMGLMEYACTHHPNTPIYLSVQASATNWLAIDFYRQRFGIKRAVLPRVLSLAQITRLIRRATVDIELFGFGSLCVMAEGRCALSSYATGQSPNAHGVCSPAHAVRWEETPQGRNARVNEVLIDCYARHEPAGYPTLCKGRFQVGSDVFHAIEEPTSLNALDILPQLLRMGVKAIKVEGRQRSAAYVGQATRLLRAALDACDTQDDDLVPDLKRKLDRLAEGRTHTLGAYDRLWQ